LAGDGISGRAKLKLIFPIQTGHGICKNRQPNRRTEAMRGGRRSTSFKPGTSGNPGGRPKKPGGIEARRIVADVKALARSVAPEAVKTLRNIMNDPKAPPAARIGAATAILDRGYGRPGQSIEVSGTVAAYDLSTLSEEELDQLEALLLLAGGPVIDETGQRIGVD
jgi:hypothetical protein